MRSISMSAMFSVPKELLENLKCSNCGWYISLGPVTRGPSGYLCGRCPGDPKETVEIYETIARSCLFPCKNSYLGCAQSLSFGEEVKAHEASCDYKPFSCPNLPLEKCEWQGQLSGIWEHYRDVHPDLLLYSFIVDVNLRGTTEKRYLHNERGGLYLLDVVYYEEKGMSVEVMSLNNNSCKYDVLLRSNYQEGVMTLPKTASPYVPNSNFPKISKDLIDANMLRYIGDEEITLQIVLKDAPEIIVACDLCKLSSCGCSLEDVSKAFNKSAKYVFHACKNRNFGCSYMSYLLDVKAHEDECFLRDCPLKSDNCSWKGKLQQIPAHASKNHAVSENLVTLKMAELVETLSPRFYVLKSVAHGYFRVCLRFDKEARVMYAAVQYLGDASTAGKFVFDVKFYTEGTTNRKSFVCAPLMSDEETFDYCAHFSYDTLRDSTVTFTVRRKYA